MSFSVELETNVLHDNLFLINSSCWRYMATLILVNIGLGNGLLPDLHQVSR